jgi:signal transduction histidine kinase
MERCGLSYDYLVHDLLRSLWEEPRPPYPPQRVWRDWALVGALVPAVVLEGVFRPDLPWRALSVIVGVGLLPTLLWRRTRPLLMVAIAFVATSLASLVIGGDLKLNSMVYMLFLPYALFRWGSGREAVIGATIMLGKVCLWLIIGYLSFGNGIGGLGVLSAAIALGAAFRYRTRARMRELDQVKLLERERLARDLHDTIAHHVSAMAIRAQAGLATSASHPDAATDALRVIEAEASRALAEMRSMVRVLRRNQPADLAPSPRIRDLEQLAGRSRAGPAVDVEIFGDLDDVPESVGAAIYRLAQESVTNARRHARHATRIEVRVAADDTLVHLSVSDDGDTGPNRPAASPGYGLIGMIERADLLGGTCEAGPNPDRGWTVTAILPRTGSPA